MQQKQPGTCEGVSHSVPSSSSFCVEVCRDISYFRDSSTQNGLYWDWGVCTETPKGSTRDCLGVSSSYVVCTRLKLNIEEAAETVWGSTLTYWSTTINFQEERERILLVYLLTWYVARTTKASRGLHDLIRLLASGEEKKMYLYYPNFCILKGIHTYLL